MKSSKLVNNISDKLKASIPKLKPGETVTFQMLNGVPNPEPDEKERSKSPILYGKRQILTQFRIYDPFQKDEDGKEVGGFVDMACVDVWNGDKAERIRTFVPGQGEYSQFQGKFSLTGGNVKDEELYEILWLSNEREGNPHRDSGVELLFKIIDLKADTKKSVSKVQTLHKALNLVKDIQEEKARKILVALNQPDYQDVEVLKAKVGELASSNPEMFIKIYEDEATDIKYQIKQAFDKGVLVYDFSSGVVKMGGVQVAKLKLDKGADMNEEFTKFLSFTTNGKELLNSIQNQLKEQPEVVK
jgi:hypothetical protein